jgi:hypothetical protein
LGERIETCGVGLDEFAEAVISDGFSRFSEGYFWTDFFAATIEDGIGTREDIEGGTKST